MHPERPISEEETKAIEAFWPTVRTVMLRRVLHHSLISNALYRQVYPPRLLEERTILLPTEEFMERAMKAKRLSLASPEEVEQYQKTMITASGVYFFSALHPSDDAIFGHREELVETARDVGPEEAVVSVLAEELSHALVTFEAQPLSALPDGHPYFQPHRTRKPWLEQLMRYRESEEPFDPSQAEVFRHGFMVGFRLREEPVAIINEHYREYEEVRAAIMSFLLESLYYGQEALSAPYGGRRLKKVDPVLEFYAGMERTITEAGKHKGHFLRQMQGSVFYLFYSSAEPEDVEQLKRGESNRLTRKNIIKLNRALTTLGLEDFLAVLDEDLGSRGGFERVWQEIMNPASTPEVDFDFDPMEGIKVKKRRGPGYI